MIFLVQRLFGASRTKDISVSKNRNNQYNGNINNLENNALEDMSNQMDGTFIYVLNYSD